MADVSAGDLVEQLELRPHPEGGYYREVHRSAQTVRRGCDDRAAVTTIYYLLEIGQHSRWHAVTSDEVWHFLAGEPLELISFETASSSVQVTRLGPITDLGAAAVRVVPAHDWQAARPLGDFALVGCTVGPGFDFADFRFVADIPGHEEAFDRPLARYRDLL